MMKKLFVFALLGFFWLGMSTHAIAVPADVPQGGVRAASPSSTSGAEVLILSVVVGIPYASLNLVPVIGNLIVMPGTRFRKARMGWGITGVVMGGIGLLGGISLAAYSASIGAPEMIPFTLPMTVVGVTSLALGFVNIFNRPRPLRFSQGPDTSKVLAADATLFQTD